ncbi:hypothetical protein SBA5_400059 [Candidatus Sulfotelmatomonas gaucii]|uniref:Uncharacterized protein n=1 Tax=Candidatus Sulfuritelmatomonas gaucii TaxID=2043161 RepID=A0A2N9LK50_9BACT|nr:hypothetical protein SBA5_400059 [Candidatus Sulfotelmatomonas gaucii]
MSLSFGAMASSDVGHKEGEESHPVERCLYSATRSGWNQMDERIRYQFPELRVWLTRASAAAFGRTTPAAAQACR